MIQSRESLLQSIYLRLHETFGHQGWWPAETPFEVILGAILTQNTAWKNVTRAIANLRERNLLSFRAVLELPTPVLAELIRPSGFYNQKAKKVKIFCEYVSSRWNGSLKDFLSQEADSLRSDLLSIRGIGPETADSIVLYAAHQPSFVVDTYTHRIFSRHGWVDEAVGYDELRDYFMAALEPDVCYFQDFHALLVKTGHLFCRRKPLCTSCPLNIFFDPASG